MKKKIFSIAMTLLFVASAFAFPFRTTCNQVIQVNNPGLSLAALAEVLGDLNEAVCGVKPTHIVFY